ncbi:hypothetical protein Phou_027190 [Phytohabitans houttuyneae]|uniref:Uncharacterized protein n=1 Tax=Phytohabitans houttuyneae TaxID=1076126 RepID=A0A6V8K8S6_9ACTN|nr:hypothetical protein Phou_027190 [Phytohabitans houttuyneae]
MDALFFEEVEVGVFFGEVAVAVAEDDGHAGGAGGVFDSFGDVGEEGVGDVEDDEAEGAARPRRSWRAASLGTNPSSAIAASTRARVAFATMSGRLRTLETVPTDTPAWLATSRMLTSGVSDTVALLASAVPGPGGGNGY